MHADNIRGFKNACKNFYKINTFARWIEVRAQKRVKKCSTGHPRSEKV